MPRLAKWTKVQRNEGAIQGIRKHLTAEEQIRVRNVDYGVDELVAVFEEQLEALAQVERLTNQRRVAIARERAIEKRVRPIHAALKKVAEGRLGVRSPRLREFGIEPDKQPRMTAETKVLANEKRQATRKDRGILGKRQVQAWKKKRREGGT